MKQTEINRLEMFQVTNEYLDMHNSVWSTIPIVGTYKNGLSDVIGALKKATGDQLRARVFIGKSLQALKKTIAEKMDILDDTLEAFAEDTGDAVLVARTRNTQTDYFRLPYEDFETGVKEMIDVLEEKREELANYGVTSEQLEEVKADVDRFLEQRGKPAQYRIASGTATKEIGVLLTEGNVFLEKLDRVLKRFKRANPSFYNGYKSARKVIDH